MVAYAMLFEHYKDEKYWSKFVQIAQYTFAHFSDASGDGEWFGYLDRSGNPTHMFKGGPYKGCFHVPRALHLVSNSLSFSKKKK